MRSGAIQQRSRPHSRNPRAEDLLQKGAGTLQRQQQTKSDPEAQQANTTRAKTAVAPAIPSEPADRACCTIRHRLPADHRRDDALFPGAGLNASDAASQATAWVGQTLQRQIDFLAPAKRTLMAKASQRKTRL